MKMTGRERTFIACLLSLAVLFIAVAAFGGCGCGGGGDGGSASGAQISKQTERALALFLADGALEGKNLLDAEALVPQVTAENADLAFLVGASYLRSGRYEKGKAVMAEVLDKGFDRMVNFWGDAEKLRTLAASELAYHAGREGDSKIILWIEERMGRELVPDQLLVRDGKGILAGKTKLRDVLRFHKARAFHNEDDNVRAKEVLAELSFASGKIFVDGEVQGLSEAVAKLQAQVEGVAQALRALFA
jgi:hypothetical protein